MARRVTRWWPRRCGEVPDRAGQLTRGFPGNSPALPRTGDRLGDRLRCRMAQPTAGAASFVDERSSSRRISPESSWEREPGASSTPSADHPRPSASGCRRSNRDRDPQMDCGMLDARIPWRAGPEQLWRGDPAQPHVTAGLSRISFWSAVARERRARDARAATAARPGSSAALGRLRTPTGPAPDRKGCRIKFRRTQGCYFVYERRSSPSSASEAGGARAQGSTPLRAEQSTGGAAVAVEERSSSCGGSSLDRVRARLQLGLRAAPAASGRSDHPAPAAPALTHRSISRRPAAARSPRAAGRNARGPRASGSARRPPSRPR